MCCQQENHFKHNIGRLKVKRMKTICHANTNQKKIKGAITILDKVDFTTRKITRDKEGHYMMLEEKFQ